MTDAADLELIREAAVEAGALARRLQDDGKVRTWSKPGGSPVTTADMELDRRLKQRLLEARPDYGWLSEETVDDSSRLSARRTFVVDPIDGTVAFIKDRPWWAVSIAVVEASFGAPLMTTARRPYATTARCSSTSAAAIPIAAIAPPAKEEDLRAFRACDESKRVHVPSRDARNLIRDRRL